MVSLSDFILHLKTLRSKYLVLYLFLCFSGQNLFSQVYLNIDSLIEIETTLKGDERLKALIQIAEIKSNSSTTEAKKYAQQALALATKTNNASLRIKPFVVLANCEKLNYNYQAAINYLEQAVVKTDSAAHPSIYYKLKYEIAEIKILTAEYQDAKNYAFTALQYFTTHQQSDTLGLIYNLIGKAHWLLGELDNANEMLIKALSYFESKNNIVGQAMTYNLLGNLFYSLENYNRALSYYDKALSIIPKFEYQSFYADILNNKAEVYEVLRDNAGALKIHKASYSISKSINHLPGLAVSCDNIGEIFMNTEKYDSAQYYFNLALKYAQQMDYKYALIYVYNNLGKLYTLNKNYSQAEINLKNAESIANITHLKEPQLLTYLLLVDLYKKTGRYEEALNYYILHVKVKEILGNEKMTNRIAELQVKYEADKKQSQIDILNENNQLITNLNKRQSILLLFSALAVLSLTILLIMLFQKDKKNKQANALLAAQNAEIQTTQQELQRVNSELKESSNRLKLIVQKLPIIMNAIDEEGHFVFWNEECERVSGYSKAEMVGNKDAIRYLYPNERDRKMLTTGILNKKDFRNEITKITCKDQSIKIISWSNVSKSAPIPGWWEWIVGIDITERYKFENSLQQEKAILNSLINSLPFVVYYKDLSGKYIGYNPAFSELNNHIPMPLIGKTDFDLLPKDEAEIVAEIEAELLRDRKVWTGEYWYSTPDGKNIFFQTSKSPIINDKGEIIGLVVISRDITERFEYEQELQKARLKAEQSDKLKSAFLANMSHEIRTPMNAIIGFAELLNNHDLTNEQRDLYIQYINNSGNNLLNLIDDIIDTAKIEAGQIKIRKAKTNINKVLDELHASFSDILKRKNIQTVALNLSKHLDDKWMLINTDSNRLRQIISNLISNAIKFTDQGYIHFGYKYKEQEDELEFFVSDTGIGIPEDKFQIIFERFGQIDKDIARNTKGTGLGLNITQKLVELLGGKIWVVSELGRGSTFYFTIPYSPVKDFAEEKTDEHNFSSNSLRSSWPGKTVLVVEDDKLNFTILKKYLQKTRINILWAQNGKEAVDICTEHHQLHQQLDLILMDMHMPLLNGYEATRQIKSIMPNIPIIAQTANAMHTEKEDALEAGCNDYITKPIKQSQLLDLLNKHLN